MEMLSASDGTVFFISREENKICIQVDYTIAELSVKEAKKLIELVHNAIIHY